MDRFSEMRAFVEVVKAGAFVKGAEALNLSKAAISRQIGDLERRLGTRLIHRTTRRLSVTEEGQRFYEQAKELLAGVATAEAEVMTRSKVVGGHLRINAPLSFGVLHLAPVWAAFKVKHPKATLDITLGDRVVDLVNDGYDVAIRIAQMQDSTLVSRRLATTRMVLCASPTYLRKNGTPRHPGELAKHSTISYTYWSTGDDWHFNGPDGPVIARVHPCMHANNGDTCRAAALCHNGIILQPTFLIGQDLKDRKLVEVLPDFHSVELGIYAVYPTRRFLLPRVRAIVDFLAEHFMKPRWPE